MLQNKHNKVQPIGKCARTFSKVYEKLQQFMTVYVRLQNNTNISIASNIESPFSELKFRLIYTFKFLDNVIRISALVVWQTFLNSL